MTIINTNDNKQIIDQIKTWLFVPATKLTLIAKAFASGADAVIIDLEDAVALEDKAQAREDLLEYFSDENSASVWLRINKAGSAEFDRDIELCRQLPNLAGIILAKAEQHADIEQAHSATGLPIIALIESALGLYQLEAIAKATGLAAFSYGFLDLCNDLGVQVGTPAADIIASQIRYQLILTSTVHQLAAPIDTIYPNFKDSEGLTERVKLWSQMGMSGMLCIHPKQVAVVSTALQPTDSEIEFAKEVIAEYERSEKAVFKIKGQMIDAPVIQRCYRILGR
ncbi:CoA ester lyase [Psychrobacter sp. AH5]|uniref:HpcH/HpaI aldolase/citrate lyase family protein n=1 Tax=Psychrobacter sp. AH5 TaxID=2937433 RepID=UPI00333EEAF1